MKNKYNIIGISFLLICNQAYSASLSYKELSRNNFELYIESDVFLEISQAQEMIYPAAVQLCKSLKPLYGKYKFKGDKPISTNDKEKNDSLFSFQQSISCVANINTDSNNHKANLTKEESKKIESKVKILTSKYLYAKENGDYKFAYNMLTSNMKNISNFKAWKKKESELYMQMGELKKRDIWRITLYDNPDSSPKPGVYVAADYESEYVNTPVHCGYTIWFISPDNNDIKVMREEFGSIDKNTLKNISQSNLANVRKQIGCNAF